LILNVNKVLCFANDLLVGILDAMLGQDSTAPVGAAADDLSSCIALFPKRLRAQRLEGVLDIVTTRVLGTLHSDKVFVVTKAALKSKPIHALITLVLIPLDEVPPKDEVLRNIVDTVSHQAHGYIVPRHPAILCLAEFIRLPLAHTLEIHYAVVIEILTGEDLVLHVRGVDIGQRVLVSIPAAKAKVDSTDKSQGVIDDDEFLMVGLQFSAMICEFGKRTYPVQCHVRCILEDVVVRMTQDLDVPIAGTTFRAEVAQSMFRMCRVASQCLVDLTQSADGSFQRRNTLTSLYTIT
jgi:hypothetical protein